MSRCASHGRSIPVHRDGLVPLATGTTADPGAPRPDYALTMPFSADWLVRDCPWCGLRDAQMQHLALNLNADRRASASRCWSVVSCPACGGAVLIEHTAPNDPHAELLTIVPAHSADAHVENVPAAVRPYYEDAVRVLEAVGMHAANVDEKTGRRALQYTTRVLRNLFELPAEPGARPGPAAGPADEPQ